MSFKDEDEALLKTWLEKRLSKISDAEAPILAEYCIALLRHDQSEEEVRNLCVDQLSDFLKGDTRAFVSDVFEAIKSRSFVGVNSKIDTFRATQSQDRSRENHAMTDKRSKAPPSQQRLPAALDIPEFPEMPLPPQSMMLDPSFIQYMQGLQGMQHSSNSTRKRKHCFAFERDGTCPRGSACPYEHVSQVQRNFHEYDPKFSGMNGSNTTLTTSRSDRNGNKRSDQKLRGPQHDKSKSTLVIENIPLERLNETSIRDFFQSFGEIVSTDVNVRDRMATIKFVDWDTANAVYSSPAPVFDNRFVKIFWLQENGTQRHKKRELTKSNSIASGTELDPAVVAAKQQLHEQRLARMSDMEKRKTILKEQQDALQKKKQEQAAILQSLQGGEHTQGTGSADTPRSALQAQLDQLKLKAAALGVSSEDFRDSTSPRGSRGRGAHVYRGGYRGRGRGRGGQYSGGPRSLDLRPKTLRITNDQRPIAEVEAQIRQQAVYEAIEVEASDTIKVSFKSRFEAEAFSANSSFGKMSWVTSDTAPLEQSAVYKHDNNGNDSRMMDEDFDRYDN